MNDGLGLLGKPARKKSGEHTGHKCDYITNDPHPALIILFVFVLNILNAVT